MDKKTVFGAVVSVFEGSNVVANTSTNKLGKFWVELELQKNYVIQFKKKGAVQKVLISTISESGAGAASKVLVFALSSKNKSTEGPGTSDVVTSFHMDNRGALVQKKEEVVAHVEETKETKVDEKVEELTNTEVEIQEDTSIINKEIAKLEDDVEQILEEIPEADKDAQIEKYKLLQAKKDSIIFLAEKKADLIVEAAENKSRRISKEAMGYMKESADAKKKLQQTKFDIKKQLRRLAVEEKAFLEREDIKEHNSNIEKLNKKGSLSKRDSVEYLSSKLQISEEFVKAARLQLEIDRLNAKTEEDFARIAEREAEIFLAEQEIKEAESQIALQKLEIKQINQWLTFVISALIFFVLLLLLVYKSFRDKKKSNIELELRNKEIAKKNKKIIDSIRYAQTIQQAILPIKTNIDKYFDWFVIFQPKDIVSGDFYWFNHFEELNKSVFAVVDCTGHGVPGAFMSLIGNRLLIEAVKEKGMIEPVDILEQVDKEIRTALMQDETSNNDGMDICVCTLEYIDGGKCKIEFAGAKRPLFYTETAVDKTEVQHIKGTVRGIGGKKRIREKATKKPFQKHTVIAEKGEILYLTTDGHLDLQSPNRKKFGRVNFMNLLQENCNKPLDEQKEAIMDALHEHKGSEFQIDDITILGVKI